MTINDEDCSDTQILTIDILNYITLIINQSLTSYIYLDSLKVANVTPIYKKNTYIITNCRPIIVLPVISKVFENVLFDQLGANFVTNNVFSLQQYGFRKNSSRESTALELLDRLYSQLDKHKIPINFYINLSTAFDSLRHILLDKLTHYGVTISTANKSMSYLCNHKQFDQIRK